MNPVAFRRGMARDFVRWRMCGRGQGEGDRLWQDKARKVPAVGWEEEGSNFNHAPNIAKYRAHLAMFGKVLSPLNSRHPVSPR
jgi:hypothetical protein